MVLGDAAAAVEEEPANDGAQYPADAIAGLGEVNTGGGGFPGAQNGGAGVGHGFKEGQSHGEKADPEEKGPEGVDEGGGNKPKAAEGDDAEANEDAALVAEPARNPAGGERNEEVAEVMGKLDPGRLGASEVKLVLEVLVHDIDHAIAEAPEEEEGTDEDEGDEVVAAVLAAEEGDFIKVLSLKN